MPDYFSDFSFGARGQIGQSGAYSRNSSDTATITRLEGGGYVVVYETGINTLSTPTRIQIFDANGDPVGDPIDFVGKVPDVTGLADGGFVVVWDNQARVNAQVYNADGSARGDVIAFTSNSDMREPAVTALENGNFVVAWYNSPPLGTATTSIRAQIFDPDGTPVTAAFTAAQNIFVNSFLPEIDALADGGFVVTWGTGNGSGFLGSEAQAFTSAGVAVGARVVAADPGEPFSNRESEVAGLPNGNYVMAWMEVTVNDAGTALDTRVMAAIYTVQGTIVGEPFQVNSLTQYNAGEPDIAVLDDGSFMITWRSDVPDSTGSADYRSIGDIRAQLFSPGAERIGDEFTVNTETEVGQLSPAITAFGSGDIAVIWLNFEYEFSYTTNLQLRNLFSVTNGDAGSNVMAGTDGVDVLRGLDGVDFLTGGLGDDNLDGGSNVDTAIVSGLRADYTVTQIATGVFQVVGADGDDLLTGVEFLRFDDEVLRLLPGTGVNVNFETADPGVYQSALDAIRDFDGNALGGNGAWLRIGSADINGDGDIDQILVNDAIGRFATVGTQGGLVYFDDYSWAGETRVAGIYIDPLVASGDVEAGSDNDSQRRFQNDLQIENINRVLGADDYDGDGIWEVYFALTDGTAYLRALMHEDGNIRYANYQSEQEVIDYLTANGYDESTYGDWFASPVSSADTVTFVNEAPKPLATEVADGPPQPVEQPFEIHSRIFDTWQSEAVG